MSHARWPPNSADQSPIGGVELARFLEMPPASVAPVAARLEKMRIPKILPGVITSLQQAGPVWGHPRTDNAVGAKVASAQRGPAGFISK
jgi:hypothetical protein